MTAATEERCLAAIAARLLTVTGTTRAEIDPPDDHGDGDVTQRFAILPGDVVEIPDPQRAQVRVSMPVTIRGVTQAAPTAGNSGLPLSARTAGYALWAATLPKLFPGSFNSNYVDRLEGNCIRFSYKGHAIYPRDDGAKTTGVYIDCEVEYVLHLTDPSK